MNENANSPAGRLLSMTSTEKDRFITHATLVLHNMALENTGLRGWFTRWRIAAEPLRNDAANLLRCTRLDRPRPEGTRYVKDED